MEKLAMSNAATFTRLYNDIDKLLRKKLERGEWASFSKMVNELKSKDPLIKQFSDDLLQFANLRNAIVHTNNGNKTIAVPYNETVEAIELIKNKLCDPPKVKLIDVFSVTDMTTLANILVAIKEYNFSQIPILDQNQSVIEIINTNTIARWLSTKTTDDIINLEEICFKELEVHIEYKKNFQFISVEANLYEVAAKFHDYSIKNTHNLDALFVTETGNSKQKPIGIYCIEDIAAYLIK